jgi:hypothetical protein
MPSAQHSFVLIWKRVVAALSLVAAALIAPTAPAPMAGAGMAGSRAGSGPAIAASTANALLAAVDGLVEGGERNAPLQESAASGPQSAPCLVAAWLELPAPRPVSVSPAEPGAPSPTFAARAGLSRAPPQA